MSTTGNSSTNPPAGNSSTNPPTDDGLDLMKFLYWIILAVIIIFFIGPMFMNMFNNPNPRTGTGTGTGSEFGGQSVTNLLSNA